MAARLVAQGVVRDPLWRSAFVSVPRHLLLAESPMMPATGPIASWWLDAVYGDPADTDTSDTGCGGDARSAVAPSQPSPELLAWLLELLIPAGYTTAAGGPVRVLEIGAGHGYTTALLCHRVGAEQVTATTPHGTEHLAAALAELDLFPALVTAADPLAASVYGPFDAILCATGGYGAPSRAWLQQLGAGGRIVSAVRGPDGRVAAVVFERAPSGAPVQSRMIPYPSAGVGS